MKKILFLFLFFSALVHAQSIPSNAEKKSIHVENGQIFIDGEQINTSPGFVLYDELNKIIFKNTINNADFNGMVLKDLYGQIQKVWIIKND